MAVASILLVAGCSFQPRQADNADGTFTIRFAHQFSTRHVIAKNALAVWMEEVEKRTGGRVEFDYYPGGQLIEAKDIFPAIKSGVIDVGYFVPANAAGAELPLSDISAVPGFGADESLADMQEAYWDLLDGILGEKDYLPHDVRPLMGILAGKYQVLSVDKPLDTKAAWKGQSVRSAGGASDFAIANLGASAIHIESGEVYEAMQRGTIDAGLNTLEAIPSYAINEVANFGSTNAPFGAGPTVLVIREDLWKDLPADIQQAMNEARAVATANLTAVYADEIAAALDEFSGDMDFYELTPEQLAQMEPAMKKAQKQWVKQREAPGKPAQDVLDQWEAALARHSSAD